MLLAASKRCFILFLCGLLRVSFGETSPIALEAVGDRSLRILAPTLLELSYVTTKDADPAPVTEWNFVGENFTPNLPPASAFLVEAGGQPVSVTAVGFKRRPLYAPLRKRDLRIGNYLYLTLAQPIGDGQNVVVKNPAGDLWAGTTEPYAASMDRLRFNPALHMNQVGYLPTDTKKGMVGYYLGSLGEMPIAETAFNIVDAANGAVAFTGSLVNRQDVGYTYSPAPYQQVYEADFSAFQAPGEYRLHVEGLGVSFPFQINAGVAAVFARAHALGLYHQRCGSANSLPHTRHEHGICHAAPASVPDMTYPAVNALLAAMSADFFDFPNHTAPRLENVDACLYPFVNLGPIDVSMGHHDAGDYSKYTINSAGLIHHLVFAADALGAGDLDNLGLPESGDGRSDLLQEAKREADFLAKMQDADGGFYFLVYPRDRPYEDDVLPDQGDPQVVFPKTTAATAAAVGALAEIASSPRFKQQFPVEAAAYLARAQLGWEFLMLAIATHGKNGAYQKITHYGNEFMHDDELAWAAAALFAATGDVFYHAKLLEFYPNPNDIATRRWDWWRLFEGYGCAARTYAFAVRSGRLLPAQLDPAYLALCEAEIIASGDDIARFAEQTAYGTSFPDPHKAFRSAGWYFSTERAFEMATAFQVQGSNRYLDAIVSNLAYEAGCNPINMTFITGLGWRRWREIVHQYALNDTRVLPPSGLPLGNIQSGFAYLNNYRLELGALCFPPDGAGSAPYPFYDRFGDSFNTTTEFVVVDQARGLATTAFLLARTGDATSPSQGRLGTIQGLPSTIPAGSNVSATLDLQGVDLGTARIVWEARDQEPYLGGTFTFAPKNPGEQWIEAEAQLPDGRRVFATNRFTASFPLDLPANAFQSRPVTAGPETMAIYHLDSDLSDASGRSPGLALSGHAAFDAMNLGWMQTRSGAALHFNDLGDLATVTLPAELLFTNGLSQEITLEAMIYVQSYKGWNRGHANILTLVKDWNASLEFFEDIYAGPLIRGGSQFGVPGPVLAAELPLQQWLHLSMSITAQGYSARIDGKTIATAASAELAAWDGGGSAILEFGNFDGWIDEIVVRAGSPVPLRVSATADGELGFAVQFTSPVGSLHDLEYNDDFPTGPWNSALQGTPSHDFTDATASSVSNRVYRVLARLNGETQISEYAGFRRSTFKGHSDTLTSLPFTRPPEALGTVFSTDNATVRISGVAPWAVGQWVYASGVQTNTYYLLISSGARAGEYRTITGNGPDILTLEGDALTGVVPGDRAAIIPHWTLGTVFPGGKGIHPSATAATRATEIYIANRGAVAGLATYYFRNGTWRQVGQGPSVKNDEVILPDIFLIVRNNLLPATEVTVHGSALHTPFRLSLGRNATGTKDNLLALPRPNAVSLNDSGLIQSGAFRPSLSAATRTDELFVFPNNQAPVTYYHRSGTWRKVGAGSVDFGSEKVFAPGAGFIIRAAAGSEPSIWINQPDY